MAAYAARLVTRPTCRGSSHNVPRRILGALVVAGLAFVWLLVPNLSIGAVTEGAARAVRLDASDLAEVEARTASLPRLHSLLLSIDGELVEERYYNRTTARSVANLKSASKTIIGILVGIAIDLGQLMGVDQPIADFFPEEIGSADDSLKQGITVGDLLTMRSGLETTSNRNYGQFVASGNWVRHILTRPMVDRPGGRMVYSTGSSHALSAILTEATGMSTLAFARRHLAEPLGITLPAWLQDPQGIYFGGNEMRMTSRDMLKIGELYLRLGAMHGRQIVSEGWVHASLVPRTRSRFSGREYGYAWWMRTLAGRRVYYAWGYGGQFIFMVPDLDATIVVTSSPDPGGGRREHLRSVYDLVERQLIPAAARARRAEPGPTP